MPPTLAIFTDLELIIACGVAEGLPNALIGAQIGMSGKRVSYYLNRCFRRLGLRDRTALALLLYSIA